MSETIYLTKGAELTAIADAIRGKSNSAEAMSLSAMPEQIASLSTSTYINVKDFGAKGDGITDDATALQSAINYAQESGVRAVYLPAGTYITSTPLHAEVETGTTSVGGKTLSRYSTGMGLTIRGEQVGKTILRKTGQAKYTIPTSNNINGGTEIDATFFGGGQREPDSTFPISQLKMLQPTSATASI